MIFYVYFYTFNITKTYEYFQSQMLTTSDKMNATVLKELPDEVKPDDSWSMVTVLVDSPTEVEEVIMENQLSMPEGNILLPVEDSKQVPGTDNSSELDETKRKVNAWLQDCSSDTETEGLEDLRMESEMVTETRNLKIRCGVCDIEMLRKDLAAHIRRKHPTQKVILRCPVCQNCLLSSNFPRHMRQFHGTEEEKNKEKARRMQEKGVKISCRVCEMKMFKQYLKRHMRNQHSKKNA